MKAYVVPEISSVPNTHVELAKPDYPHLKGLWFSDVSKERQTTCGIFRKGAQSGGSLTSPLLWKRNWGGSCQDP